MTTTRLKSLDQDHVEHIWSGDIWISLVCVFFGWFQRWLDVYIPFSLSFEIMMRGRGNAIPSCKGLAPLRCRRRLNEAIFNLPEEESDRPNFKAQNFWQDLIGFES